MTDTTHMPSGPTPAEVAALVVRLIAMKDSTRMPQGSTLDYSLASAASMLSALAAERDRANALLRRVLDLGAHSRDCEYAGTDAESQCDLCRYWELLLKNIQDTLAVYGG